MDNTKCPRYINGYCDKRDENDRCKSHCCAICRSGQQMICSVICEMATKIMHPEDKEGLR